MNTDESSLGRRPMGETGRLKTQTKHGIIAVILFVLALFFLMSAFDLAGVAGKFIYLIQQLLQQ